MKKNVTLYIAALFVLTGGQLMAQVGIQTSSPEGVLDINSGTTGVVYPIVTLSNLTTETILNPNAANIVAGTCIYNSLFDPANNLYPGLYFWDGTKWVPQSGKRDNELFVQDTDVRTGSNETTYGDQAISFDNSTFTPIYTGAYKITVTVHFGGGTSDNPDLTDQFVNMTQVEGQFNFTFNGTPHVFTLDSYSGTNHDTAFTSSEADYTNMFNQVSYNFTESLVYNSPYSFTLNFNQNTADGFEDDGDAINAPLDGRGYIIINDTIKCFVEINYVGD